VVVQVIVIVALAEELLALLILLVTLLSEMLASATEMSVSVMPSRTNAIKRIARMTIMINLFTSTLLIEL
jgi:hypothetical protein